MIYKPKTILIMTELWAAAAAHKLGFEVESEIPFSANTSVWTHGFIRAAKGWKITVTEFGPNAAERFLPQLGDWAEDVNGNRMLVIEILADDPRWIGNAYQSGIQNPFIECRSIIERNGIPFPQFSEVIEPERKDNNGL